MRRKLTARDVLHDDIGRCAVDVRSVAMILDSDSHICLVLQFSFEARAAKYSVAPAVIVEQYDSKVHRRSFPVVILTAIFDSEDFKK